jgi:hypothetical protein
MLHLCQSEFLLKVMELESYLICWRVDLLLKLDSSFTLLREIRLQASALLFCFRNQLKDRLLVFLVLVVLFGRSLLQLFVNLEQLLDMIL